MAFVELFSSCITHSLTNRYLLDEVHMSNCVKFTGRRLFHVPVLIIFVLAVLINGCLKNSAEPENKTETEQIDVPTGCLYFLSANPSRIYRYDFQNDFFEVVVDDEYSDEWFDVSQDGKMLAFVSKDSLLGLVDLHDFSTTYYSYNYEPYDNISINHDGTKIAYQGLDSTGHWDIILVDVETGEFTNISNSVDLYNDSPMFSANSEKLVWEQSDGIFETDLINLTNTKIYNDTGLDLIDLSPDGNFAIVEKFSIHTGSEIRIVNINNRSILTYPQNYVPIQFFGDDKIIAFLENDSLQNSELVMVDFLFSSPETLANPARRVEIDKSPDSQFICVFETTYGQNKLYVIRLSDKEVVLEKNISITDNTFIEYVFWRNLP